MVVSSSALCPGRCYYCYSSQTIEAFICNQCHLRLQRRRGPRRPLPSAGKERRHFPTSASAEPAVAGILRSATTTNGQSASSSFHSHGRLLEKESERASESEQKQTQENMGQFRSSGIYGPVTWEWQILPFGECVSFGRLFYNRTNAGMPSRSSTVVVVGGTERF